MILLIILVLYIVLAATAPRRQLATVRRQWDGTTQARKFMAHEEGAL